MAGALGAINDLGAAASWAGGAECLEARGAATSVMGLVAALSAGSWPLFVVIVQRVDTFDLVHVDGVGCIHVYVIVS